MIPTNGWENDEQMTNLGDEVFVLLAAVANENLHM